MKTLYQMCTVIKIFQEIKETKMNKSMLIKKIFAFLQKINHKLRQKKKLKIQIKYNLEIKREAEKYRNYPLKYKLS